MENIRNKILKIFAGLFAILLIGGILFITNAFVGNPISAKIAEKTINQYVKENYSFLDLEVEKPIYNFKFNEYISKAKSRTSIDTKFNIYYRNGKVHHDNYESFVLKKFNTIERFSHEYTDFAKRIIAKELRYEKNNTRVMYDKTIYENGNDALQLDMKFDKSLPIDAEVNIGVDVENVTIENIAKILIDAHKAFIKNSCYFKKYGLFIENDKILVMVSEVTSDDIESGDLVSLLQSAKDYKDDTIVEEGEEKYYEERMSVYIRYKDSENN
ncbi:hypothetical protein [Tissierella praeacuta]|uniref:YfjL-like protein n=1 Tax=Tissierella praeacuta TaxID=43131 RepID=UPI001C11A079|nr:hypothetical protein [Tissierella praeacuta]MBU5256984.1 hypothetical protein [Tissierella praeacuta]